MNIYTLGWYEKLSFGNKFDWEWKEVSVYAKSTLHAIMKLDDKTIQHFIKGLFKKTINQAMFFWPTEEYPYFDMIKTNI